LRHCTVCGTDAANLDIAKKRLRIIEMQKSARARAEERFAATQKKGKEALNEKEKARQEITKRMARQKALRLAKEAADKEAAASVEADRD
jgi:hypothetical protein